MGIACRLKVSVHEKVQSHVGRKQAQTERNVIKLVSMRAANLRMYPTSDTFECLLLLERDACLRFLMPFLEHCRKSRRISGRVAEVVFDDGLLVWFAADEGMIDAHQSRPRFGTRRTWLRFFPVPCRKQSVLDVSDTVVRDFVSSAYGGDA